MLGVSVGTVQLWVESGLLQAWKTAGGHRRVIRESVDRLLHKSPADANGTARTEVIPPAADAQKLRILVVEDDASLLRLYQVRLSAWPLAPEVQVSDNAFSALLSMGRKCPDLLITDLHMPGIDGFVMLRSLQKVPEAQDMQIVVVSGLDAAEIAARGGLPANVQVLQKPIPFDRLQQIAVELQNARHTPGAAVP